MIIRVDTREQLPYTFAHIRAAVPFSVRTECLQQTGGDYATGPDDDLRGWAVIERKSLSDLYSSVAARRPQFIRKLERMQVCAYRALVIEAEWSQVLNPNPYLRHPTRYRPKAMLATLLAWSQRYDLHIFPCPGRDAAERFTYRMLERWWCDCAGNKRRAC